MNITPPASQHFAAIAIMGAANAGKSTLLNHLLGARLAITSPKAQTTRFAMKGIVTKDAYQIAFIDTPGIFEGKDSLSKAMLKSAWNALSEADMALLLIDASKRGAAKTLKQLLVGFKGENMPLILALNKIDAMPKAQLLPLIAEMQLLHDFAAIHMISAKTGDGVKQLLDDLLARAAKGEWCYDPEQLSDINERLLAAEWTREQLFRLLNQEVPYGLVVETEKWEESDGSVKIWQCITVERESHKAIIVGEKGQKLKTIGSRARKQLGDYLGKETSLFLHVRHRADWKSRPEYFRIQGLEM